MSTYRALAYHPTSGRLEVFEWKHQPIAWQWWVGVFADGTEVSERDVIDGKPDPVDLFEVAQEMAEALGRLQDAADTLDEGDYELWEHPAAMCIKSGDIRDAVAALSRWQQFTNAKGPDDAKGM